MAFALLVVPARSADAVPFAASASTTPAPQFLGDSTPTAKSFYVKNYGQTTPIKAVEIAIPNASWALASCAAPTGWTATPQTTQCLFQSVDDTTAIAPGASLLGFVVRTTTQPGNADVDAPWSVTVSSERTPTVASRRSAGSNGPGALTGRIRTFQRTRVVVASGVVAPGAPCPAERTSAVANSTQTLLVCGRNRATGTHTPTSLSTLGGTFVQTPGTFSSTAIAPTATNAQVVLAKWTNTVITSTVGSNHTVDTFIAADSTHTSPSQTARNFVATQTPPVASSQSVSADEDTALPITLTATDAEDDNLSFSIVSPPTRGSLGSIGSADCVTTPNTCTAVVSYTPSSDYNGGDSFTFRANDGTANSNTATVTITVNPVNDAPSGVAESYDTLGNTRLYVGGGGSGPHVAKSGNVLTNDTDTDTPSANLTATAETVSSTNCGGCNNVTIAADGTFSYDPPPGFTGSDTFTYTVNDNDTGDTPSPAESGTGTVTVNVQGPLVWYVDSTPGSLTGNTGRSHSPFSSIASLAASDGSVDQDGDVIFIYSGSYSASAGMPLQPNQKLLGEPNGLALKPSGSLPLLNLVPAGGTNPVLSATGVNAAGITLANGVVIRRVDAAGSTCSGCDGVRGTSITTATIDGATNISGNAGRGVALTGAAGGNITIRSVIIGNTGNAVNVQNRSSGVVSFAGGIKTTAANGGISLANNTGATISFTASLSLSTTTGSAFSATGGGTVSATPTNSAVASKLVSTTGTALNVQNTTIGSAGLTFRSISANGGSNGIVLNATGGLGALTVTGNGGTCSTSADCSGGAIQNTTGAAISLTSTLSPSFDRTFISGSGGSGVQGTGVTGFSFTNGVINNAGNAAGESALAFNTLGRTLTGTVTVTGNTISTPFDSGLDIRADDGTVDNATVSNNTISNPGQVGINIVGTGTTTTAFALTEALISNNTVSSAGFDGIQVVVGNANATGPGGRAGTYNDPTNKVAITGNAISLDATAAQAITVATASNNSGARTQMNFDISNNGTSGAPITGSTGGTVILLGNNGFSDMSGKVSNNFIDANHDADSSGSNGIGGGNGVVTGTGPFTPQLLLNVTGNTITDTDGNGILLVTRAGSGHADLAVTNNNVAAPLGGVRPGIRVDAGNASSTDDSVCLNITGNTSAGSGGTNGIGLRKQGTVATTNDFGIVGLSPSPSTAANTATFVSSQNPSGGGTLILSGDNYVSCAAFTAP